MRAVSHRLLFAMVLCLPAPESLLSLRFSFHAIEAL
jgi:hypothetical protein